MGKSLSHKLVLLVLKLKGVKKTFKQDPIDYKKLRKENIINPKGSYFKKQNTSKFSILNTSITEIPANDHSNKLLIFIHGGAFISGPVEHHWNAIKTIHQNTNNTIWLCDYPKAPENNIQEISKNIDTVYNTALKKYDSNAIILLGDSVGGTLITTLVQRLIHQKIALPKKIILLSPVMDASMANPMIDQIDPLDPILSKKGVLSSKKMCATNDLKDPIISPLYGSFESFPETIIYLAENDITYPDQLKAVEKMKVANIKFEQIIGKEMPHIWPLLPVIKEGKTALEQIINQIN